MINLKKLGSVCDLKNGYAFKSEDYKEKGVPLLRISNFNDGEVFIDKKQIYVDEAYLISKNEFIVTKGDILIALSGATTGKYGIYNFDYPSLLNQRIGVIKSGQSKLLESRYFYYYLNVLKKDILRHAGGAAQPNISTKKIAEFKIPLPPLSTQQHIAQILDDAAALRDKTKQLLAEYDELAQSIFLDMFGDPVTNPKGWDEVILKKITSKIGSGSTPRGGKESYQEEGISLIRSLNIHDNKFKYNDLAFINDTQASKLKNVTIQENDVLINITGASVARCAIVPKSILPARVNQHVSILRCIQDIVKPIFLLHLMISPSCKLKLLGVGSSNAATRESITKVQLEDFEIILPPINLQNQFAEKIALIEQQKDLAKQELQESEDLFQALLKKAFLPADRHGKGELN